MTRDELVVLSLEPWDEIWRRNQYLLDGLLRADTSLRVLFVEPANDVVHALRSGRGIVRGRGLRTAPGYAGRLVLFQPTKVIRRIAGGLADSLLRMSIARAMRASGMKDPVFWINDPGWAGLVHQSTSVMYDITDDWLEAQRASRQLQRTAGNERLLLERAQQVVVCSPALQLSKGQNRDVVLIQNAVDVERYRTPAERPGDLPDGAIATYVGTLHEDRLDVELVARTAQRLAKDGVSLVLVGPNALAHTSTAQLHSAGVFVLGARRFDQIPAYLQHATTLIVPHVIDGFTDSLDPIKRYEYAAVGRPIVSTPVAGFREDGIPGVVVATPELFPEIVAAVVRENRPNSYGADVPDWSDRVLSMRSVIDQLRTS